jgi:hypothetical protein
MSFQILNAVTRYVEENIAHFHQSRLNTVQNIQLSDVLSRKNPYLFKAKDTQTADELIKGVFNAFISSQEETLFGTFLEGVAVFVGELVHNGYKPSMHELTGIDLIFEKATEVFAIEIKSGPHWGNSSQISKMVQNFAEATSKLSQKYPGRRIIPINGCMYGKEPKSKKIKTVHKSDVSVSVVYWKLCGQDFWYLLSEDEDFYVKIIEPLGHRAKEKNELFKQEYIKLINKYTKEFLNYYCSDEGEILWEKLISFVSQSNRLHRDIPYNFGL